MKIRLLVLLVLSGCCFGQIYNPSAAGGSGTVTSVTGTANQVDVATGTTTPVISLDAAILLPGTLNKLTLTTPATGATITIVDGKVFTVSNTITLSGTDGASLNISNAVTATAPGIGICHFAGSTQACTSSAINLAGADVTGVLAAANIATSGIANVVYNNTTNTATTAMTLDLSASTVANAFKVPIGAGLTSGADGVVAYDTTAKNTHIRTNGADSLAVAETAAITSGVIPKSGSNTLATMTASSLSDNAVRVLTTEPISVGTAAGAPGLIDITAGYTTAAMTAQSTATCTNVTGMTWNIAANKRYILSCEIPITLAASATVGFCLGGPGTATSFSLEADGPIGAAGAYAQVSALAQTAYGTKTGSSSAVGAAEWLHVKANIQNGATASGTALTLQTFGNGTNNLTVGADASCTLTQQN